MSDFSLYPTAALGGYRSTTDALVLRELTGLVIVSIATPLGEDAAVAQAIEKTFGAETPQVGRLTRSRAGKIRFLGMAPGQIFALFDDDGADGHAVIAEPLSGIAYTTDQTDVWVGLYIAGSRSRAVLERICPLDLHPDAFPENKAARTVMEHLAAIILRDGEDGFLLLAIRSSAKSFLHALETSIENVL